MASDDIEIIIPKDLERASGALTFRDGGGGVVALTVSWSATAYESSNSSIVTATMTLYANAEGYSLGGSHLTINGNAKAYSTYVSTAGNTSVTHTLVTHKVEVPHNADGTKSITISGKLVWNGYMWNGSSITLSSISGSGTVALNTIQVGTPPSNARLSIDRTGTVEGRINVTPAYDCVKPYGTVYYNYGRSVDGISWVESGWITSSSAGYTITDIQRGATHRFRVNVKNGKGESGWSSIATVKANSIPTQATGLTASSTRPVSSVTLSWTASSDADGHTITYKVYTSKNGASWQYIGETTSTSLGYSISGDGQGTKYKFLVESYDTLGVYSTSSSSGEFIKATQPSNQSISLNKSGTIEGSVTATASYTSSYPTGTTQYQFAYYYDGIAWREQSWGTSSTFSVDTSTARGKTWYFKVRVKNDAGTSDWSSTSSVKSNSAPTSVTGLNHSPVYPVSSMTLNWSAASDADRDTLTYKVYLSKNNGTWGLIATTTGTSCAYNNSADAYETKYKFKVEAYDIFNVSSTSGESAEFFKPTPPTAPVITTPTDPIAEYDFSVKWSVSNFYNLKGHYVSQKKINNGDWVELAPNSTMSTMTFPISSINRGDTIQLRAKAVNEAGQESSWSAINTTKRNRAPSQATNILPSTGYLLDVINFSWAASTDPDNHSISYTLYLSKDNSDYSYVGTTTATNYTWAIPGRDAGETTYRLKVISEDSLGATVEAIGPIIKKPTPPTVPSVLKPISGYYEGSIPLSWTHSNWYGQSGEYVIEIYVNGILNNTTSVAHTVSSYTCNLSSIPRGSKIHYRVRAKNAFNQFSSWAESTSNMYHNQIPGSPEFIYPLTNKTVYSNNPKIVLKTSTDVDGQSMTMYVKYKGVVYNSVTHPQYFSKTLLGNNEYIIFKHNANLNIGSNTVEAYVNDGFINSPSVSIVIKVVSDLSAVASENLITAASHNSRVDALDITRAAYDLTPYGVEKVIAGVDSINAKHIVDFISGLNELTLKIDSFHPNNKFKYSPTYLTPLKGSTVINKEHYNQISAMINSI